MRWRQRLRIGVWCALSAFLIYVSIQKLRSGDGHLGEWILYDVTAATVCYVVMRFLLHKQMEKGFGRLLRRLCGALAVLFVGGFGFLMLMCRADRVTYTEKYSIVLGAPVTSTGISSILLDRIETAKEFLTKDTQAIAVLTGGNSPYEGDDELVRTVTTEGGVMMRSLLEAGIDGKRLYLEAQATTTLENFSYSIALLRETGYVPGDTVVIITNYFHSYRVRHYAQDAGLQNLRILSSPLSVEDAVVWYLREIPVSILFFIQHSLLEGMGQLLPKTK